MTEHQEPLCACGKPLHYVNQELKGIIAAYCRDLGPTVRIQTRKGVWHVPRHYIALHGLKAAELPALAKQYGFEQEL